MKAEVRKDKILVELNGSMIEIGQDRITIFFNRSEKEKNETKNNKYAPSWSPEEVKKLKELYERGASRDEMQKILQKTRDQISWKLWWLKRKGEIE